MVFGDLFCALKAHLELPSGLSHTSVKLPNLLFFVGSYHKSYSKSYRGLTKK